MPHLLALRRTDSAASHSRLHLQVSEVAQQAAFPEPLLNDAGPPHPVSSLYVHVPFCRDRCTYCAFTTIPEDPAQHEPLVAALVREIRRSATFQRLTTIYLGGGTPALLAPQHLDDLLRTARSHAAQEEPREVTLEANPVNVTREMLAAWQDLGITRLSLGVQSFRDDILKWLARRHDAAAARSALDLIAQHWKGTWSADLLLGWRGQTSQDVSRDTSEVLAFDPPHLSTYSLTIEPGTPLYDFHHHRDKATLSDDENAALDASLSAAASAHGLERYEISNFARPGHRSLHNQGYWQNLDYLGIGPGASSSLHPLRWVNVEDVADFTSRSTRDLSLRRRVEQVRPFDRFLETLGVGLRTSDGVANSALEQRFGPLGLTLLRQASAPFAAEGLLEPSDVAFRIPSRHFPKADRIITELVRAICRAASLDE